ncbi:hypothetical protein [Paraburkholderia sp. DGU8]|uniref:hypothetical protein n=1 Tax=Paraburkholderia sp. DGU8 TaxID=3161997 RepID=UPI0034671CFC
MDLHNEEIVMMLVLFGNYLECHLWRELNQRSDRHIRCGIDNDVPPAAGWVPINDQSGGAHRSCRLKEATERRCIDITGNHSIPTRNNRVTSRMK